MMTKYSFSDARKILVEDLEDPYPTKWEDFETARGLDEDVFGSPRPHPNTTAALGEDLDGSQKPRSNASSRHRFPLTKLV